MRVWKGVSRWPRIVVARLMTGGRALGVPVAGPDRRGRDPRVNSEHNRLDVGAPAGNGSTLR